MNSSYFLRPPQLLNCFTRRLFLHLHHCYSQAGRCVSENRVFNNETCLCSGGGSTNKVFIHNTADKASSDPSVLTQVCPQGAVAGGRGDRCDAGEHLQGDREG